MRSIQTEVLVIGGGATGTGIVRDLAMRGFKTILVERRDLSYGTTGRYHGLLHSGGRYVVKDPAAARECITENRILRRIMPYCIEDTGGYFVVTPWDDPEYAPRFLAGCQQAGIPVEEIPVSQMLRQEPLLNPQISLCFYVPDASADSFLGAEANAAAGREYGAQVLNYHEVSALLHNHGRVAGAVCRDLVKDEELRIDADLVVNASGAWAGKIARSAGIEIQIKPGKGTMVAVNHRIVNTVVNRCKMPADGDILVPAHTVAVIGTTDVQVDDPDEFAIEPWEIRLMLEEGEKLVPGFSGMRMLRAWAGVRPLYQESRSVQESLGSRDISRAYTLLDHQTRDGLAGLVTITSGKWTTYRMMAEATVDLVCKKLGVTRPCRTHLEPLPDAQKHGYHSLGARLASLETGQSYGELVCECELATYADVRRAILEGNARTLDDIRRDVRLGMGPCQGGFCSLRAVGMLHHLRSPAVEESNAALRDFLQERWKGLLPVLWGQQLRQERLDELIYLGVLNAGVLPGPAASRLAPVDYARPRQVEALPQEQPEASNHPDQRQTSRSGSANLPDVLVVGAGLAGLVTAWRSAKRGLKTRLIAKGWGATHWSSGCIDVWQEAPQRSLEKLGREQPGHPYALAGLDAVTRALQALQALGEQAGYPLQGSFTENWLLPTALGTLRQTCLAPITMTAGDMRQPDRQLPVLVVGFAGYLDFYPALIAANLRAQQIQAESLTLELPTLVGQRFITGRSLANLMDTPDFCHEVIQALKSRWKGAVRIGFPAVLGLKHARQTWETLQAGLEAPVFEIAGLPPSIPGIRLHNLLLEAIERLGGRLYEGMQAQEASTSGKRVEVIWSEAAARQKANPAGSFVLATGGILGGGAVTESNGTAYEPVFRLPLQPPAMRQEWFQTDFFTPGGHTIYRAGLVVDRTFRPLDTHAEPYYENLFAAGGMLAGSDGIREGSLEGVALATGYALGEQIAGVG